MIAAGLANPFGGGGEAAGVLGMLVLPLVLGVMPSCEGAVDDIVSDKEEEERDV